MVADVTNAQLQTAFNGLSIMGTVFASLSALFGAYVVLFILAMWSTSNKPKSVANSRLRAITIALFIVLCTHYTSRAIAYGERRVLYSVGDELYRDGFSVPIRFVSAVTSTFAGLIADGLLAWRCYVIFDRARWALYIPCIAVLANAMLGLAGDLQLLTFYKRPELYYDKYEGVEFKVNAAWGWTMFVTNTLLTALIIGRIIYVSRRVSKDVPEKVPGRPRNQYSTIVAAIVESAFVTWLGLLLYGIATVAPHGHITTHLDIGFVMECIIPIFFGISQALMIVRLSLETAPPIYATDPYSAATSSADGGGGVNVVISPDGGNYQKSESASAGEDSVSVLDFKPLPRVRELPSLPV